MMNQLELLKQKTKIEVYWKQWIMQLQQDYPKHEIIDQIKGDPSEAYTAIGVTLTKNNLKLEVLIEHDTDTIYYGIRKIECSETLLLKISDFIKSLGFINKTALWFGFKDTSYENGYNDLKAFIDKVIKFTEL
ncbi:hypothetical protein EZS27_036137, partial [termite gut metagenome]